MLHSLTDLVLKYKERWLCKPKHILIHCGAFVLVVYTLRFANLAITYAIAKRKYKHIKSTRGWFPMMSMFTNNGILKTLQEMRDETNQGFVKVLTFGPSLWGEPMLIVNEPECFRQILEKNYTHIQPESMIAGFDWLVGNSVVLLQGAAWHHRRKLLTPIFHFEALKVAVPKVGMVTSQFMSEVEKCLGTHKVYTDKDLSLLTLTAIINVLFDAEHLDTAAISKFYQSTMSYLAMYWYYRTIIGPIWNIIPCSYGAGMFIKMIQFNNMLKAATENMRRASVSNMSLQPQDDDTDTNPYTNVKYLKTNLVQTLRAQKGLKTQDIVDEIKAFLFAGHDTTSTLLSWTIYLLGVNKDKLAVLHKELDEKLSRDNDFEPLTYEQIQSLPYCRAVLSESLRIRPPAPLTQRTLGEDMVIGGHHVKKGCLLHLFYYAAQLDPEFWESPDQFMPERWIEKERPYTHPYAYLPFSAGPRNCIGQKFARLEATMVLAMLLRRYTIDLVEPENVEIALRGTMEPENLKFVLSLRK